MIAVSYSIERHQGKLLFRPKLLSVRLVFQKKIKHDKQQHHDQKYRKNKMTFLLRHPVFHFALLCDCPYILSHCLMLFR
jgi:hypothetical protein